MRFEVIWSERALDQAAGFLKDNPEGLEQLLRSVDLLAEDPRPAGTAEYGMPDRRRLRSGRYRALYDVDGSNSDRRRDPRRSSQLNICAKEDIGSSPRRQRTTGGGAPGRPAAQVSRRCSPGVCHGSRRALRPPRSGVHVEALRAHAAVVTRARPEGDRRPNVQPARST